MANENCRPIIVTLTDSTVIKGELNIRQYTMHGRLSDVLNHPESHFLVLTNAVFVQQSVELEELKRRLDTIFINKHQIVSALPLD